MIHTVFEVKRVVGVIHGDRDRMKEIRPVHESTSTAAHAHDSQQAVTQERS